MLHLDGGNLSLEALYSTVFLLGSLAELVLLGVLLVRRQYRNFPVFTAYIAFNVLCDIVVVGGLAAGATSARTSSWITLILLPPQYLLEIGVLFEIAWHVLKPVHPSLPPKAVKTFAWLLVGALVGGALLAWHVGPQAGSLEAKIKLNMDLSVGMMRMLIFVVTAAFAQALGIGWKNRVLQLATGLSFYSAVDLVASVIESHASQSEVPNHLKGAAYLFELAFFVWAFTTKEVRRREFSPQMQEFLVTISGRVKDTRAAIVRTQAK
jgi:hypothetical protein